MLNKISWYFKRARVMSLKELLWYRPGQFVQLFVFDRFSPYFKRSGWDHIKETSVSITYEKNTLIGLLNQSSFNLVYNFFDVTIEDITEIENWREDPKSGVTSPVMPIAAIKRQDFKKHGDFKYVVELSRFYHLPFFAFKYATGEEKFRALIYKQLASWSLQNPYLRSIQWTSGIEVAIRSINLIYTHLILKTVGILTGNIDRLIKIQIDKNYHYLKNHLSLYSSANNHLMSELCGLVIISCYFQETPQFKKNINKFLNHLTKEIEIQFNPDGVNFELCTRYHAEVVDLVLNTHRFLELANISQTIVSPDRLQGMFNFIEDSISEGGGATEFGDSDNGYVIKPYFDRQFNLYRSILKTGIAMNRIAPTRGIGDFDLRNYLILGEQGFMQYLNSQNNTKSRKSRHYNVSGYSFIYYKDIKLSVDLGNIGDPLMAAHGHSDIMHFILEKEGFPFIVDCGTYQYHESQSFWRKYFRGITAHNTISVNSLDHAVYNNRMSWFGYPQISGRYSKETDNSISLGAQHDGFLKQGVDVTHQRDFHLNKENGRLTIDDQLTGNDNGSYCFYLHFNPGLKQVVLKDSTLSAVKDCGTTLYLENIKFKHARLCYGDYEGPHGWYSERYGMKEKTWSLVLQEDFLTPCNLRTILYFRDNNEQIIK